MFVRALGYIAATIAIVILAGEVLKACGSDAQAPEAAKAAEWLESYYTGFPICFLPKATFRP